MLQLGAPLQCLIGKKYYTCIFRVLGQDSRCNLSVGEICELQTFLKIGITRVRPQTVISPKNNSPVTVGAVYHLWMAGNCVGLRS